MIADTDYCTVYGFYRLYNTGQGHPSTTHSNTWFSLIPFVLSITNHYYLSEVDTVASMESMW